jgi:hypothetical protein
MKSRILILELQRFSFQAGYSIASGIIIKFISFSLLSGGGALPVALTLANTVCDTDYGRLGRREGLLFWIRRN